MRLRLRPRYQGALGAAVVVAIFVVALVVWTGKGSGDHGPAGLPTGAGAAPLPTIAAAGSGSSPDRSRSAGSRTSGSPVLSLPSTSIRASGVQPPKHAITMRVTSDDVLTGFGYLVSKGLGKPARHGAYHVKSPIIVHTTGRSYGVVAEVIAQAGPHASFITCTLTIDGVVRAHQTTHGAYKFAVCSG